MIRKFNVEKMRRNLGRNTPDAVWKSFDPLDNHVEQKMYEWQDWFHRMMKYKHGNKYEGLMVYESDMYSYATRDKRFQLIARIRGNSGRT